MSTKHKPSILDTAKLKRATKKKFAIVCSEWNSENRRLYTCWEAKW